MLDARRRAADANTMIRRPSRALMLAVAVVALSGFGWGGIGGVSAQPVEETEEPAERVDVEVFMSDGTLLEGELLREDRSVVVIRSFSSGADLVLPRSMVGRVERLAPIEDRFTERRSKLSPADVNARLRLAEWARDRRAYALALREVRSILGRDPFNREASRLEKWLTLQIELGLNRGGRGTGGGEDEADGGASEPESSSKEERPDRVFPLLAPDEINMVRVFEVDLRDPPKMVVRREVVDKLIENYGDRAFMPKTAAQRDALRRAPAEKVLDRMFRVQARELYGEVKVQEDPPAIAMFRDTVHRTWLINGCATSACHGGAEAGRLYLNRKRPNTTASVYTNLFILETFRLADGRALIDYENPEASPLLQMALPRNESLTPHPNVNVGRGRPGWRPLFRDSRERRFVEAVEWIEQMYRPRPDPPGWGIGYEPPRPEGLLEDLPDVPVRR